MPFGSGGNRVTIFNTKIFHLKNDYLTCQLNEKLHSPQTDTIQLIQHISLFFHAAEMYVKYSHLDPSN
jgi:hypothetical protein